MHPYSHQSPCMVLKCSLVCTLAGNSIECNSSLKFCQKQALPLQFKRHHQSPQISLRTLIQPIQPPLR